MSILGSRRRRAICRTRDDAIAWSALRLRGVWVRGREAGVLNAWLGRISDHGFHNWYCNHLTLFLVTPALGPTFVLTLLRLLMTSVFRLIGRGRPCSLRKRPHALQRTEPVSSRRHSGVVLVPQFWQTGCSRSRVSDMGFFIGIAVIDSESIRIRGRAASRRDRRRTGCLLTGPLSCPPAVAAGAAVA